MFFFCPVLMLKCENDPNHLDGGLVLLGILWLSQDGHWWPDMSKRTMVGIFVSASSEQ